MPNSELPVQNKLLTAHRTIGERYIPLEDLHNRENERLTCQVCTTVNDCYLRPLDG